MADHQETLANFLAITNSDEGKALQMLEATGWKLDEAVNLFFVAGDTGGGGAASAASGGQGGQSNAGGGGGDGMLPGFGEEEYVRAAIPTRIDRLYGDTRSPMASMGAQFGLNQQRQPPKVEVFKEDGVEEEGSGPRLSAMFKLPEDLLFDGSFEEAKEHASKEGKWLLLNIQCATEFDSCRLNRDTWGHESLKEMVKGMFVFYQQDMESDEGAKLVSNYRLNRLPAVLVVDPITGATLFDKAGFVDAEKLIDFLVPFMDYGPKDPEAGKLAHEMSLKRKAATSAATSSRGHATLAPLDEDSQLAQAIAASLEQNTGGGAASTSVMGPNPMDESIDDFGEEEVRQWIEQAEAKEAAEKNKPSAEKLIEEARGRLGEEPGDGPSVCRVAIRMADGQRLTRKFEKSSQVQVLYDFCVTQLPVDQAGRNFLLTMGMGPAGGGGLSDKTKSIEDVGAAGAMLLMKMED